MAISTKGRVNSFGKLFVRSVPHILENIFFSLDYDSFMVCAKVCKTWERLFSLASYKAKSSELLAVKNKFEDDFCLLIRNWDRQDDDTVEKIRYLLSRGINPNCKQGLPLRYATRQVNLESSAYLRVVKLLLDAGANPNVEYDERETPIYIAIYLARYGDDLTSSKLVKMLLDAGAMPNNATKGLTPLHVALKLGKIEVVKVLLKGGADPNIRNLEGETLLHVADNYLRNGGPYNFYTETFMDYKKRLTIERIVHVLLDAGADPDPAKKIDSIRDAPLHLAISSWKNIDIVKHLLDSGANPNRTNRQGETPLHVAAGNRINRANIEYINLLLDAGADHNQADMVGYTLLHKAASSYHIENCRRVNMALVKRLLSAGADPNEANWEGDTAISLAASAKGRNGHNGLLKLLKKETSEKSNSENINDKATARPRKRIRLLDHLDETVQ